MSCSEAALVRTSTASLRLQDVRQKFNESSAKLDDHFAKLNGVRDDLSVNIVQIRIDGDVEARGDPAVHEYITSCLDRRRDR